MKNIDLGFKDKSGVQKTLRKVGLSPAGIILLVMLGVLPLIIGDEFTIRLFISALMMGALAMSFDFTQGFINICNFGYSAFWGLGAYASAILVMRLGVSPWIGILFGGIFSAIIGLLLGMLTIRLGGIFASCMTWFMALAMMAVANNWVDLTKGSMGLTVDPLFETVQNAPYYYVLFAIVVVIYLSLMFMANSNMGLAFRAIGQDIQAASSSGISPVKYKVTNFTISCALAGFIGGFYAHYIGILTPTMMATGKTVEIMAISYIGGRGSIWGSLVCAMILVPVMDAAKGLMEWRMVIYGVLLIACMIFYPKGISGFFGTFAKFIKGKFGGKTEVSVCEPTADKSR